MGYSGKNIPLEIKRVFTKVVGARDFSINFIKKSLKNKRFPKTRDVETATINYFKKFGLDKYFLHRTGHSLGFLVDHGKYFRFDRKSRTKIKPNIPFTIEPGLYLKNKFGIRSEIDCYVGANYQLVITSKLQKEIISIRRRDKSLLEPSLRSAK